MQEEYVAELEETDRSSYFHAGENGIDLKLSLSRAKTVVLFGGIAVLASIKLVRTMFKKN